MQPEQPTPEQPMPEPGAFAWSEPTAPQATTGRYQMSLTKVTSMLIVTQRRKIRVVGSLEHLQSEYTKVRSHNLLAGWWGIPFGLIWTPLALMRNRKNMATIRQLAASQPSAAG